MLAQIGDSSHSEIIKEEAETMEVRLGPKIWNRN